MAELRDITERLLKLTRNKKLTWRSVGETSLTAETGGIALGLQKGGRGMIALSIYDGNGTLIDRTQDVGPGPLGELYEIARRSSVDVDGALAALDTALSKLERS